MTEHLTEEHPGILERWKESDSKNLPVSTLNHLRWQNFYLPLVISGLLIVSTPFIPDLVEKIRGYFFK